MTDKIKITGPNRLVIMDVVHTALMDQDIDADVHSDQPSLSDEEVTRRLNSNEEFPRIQIEIVK